MSSPCPFSPSATAAVALCLLPLLRFGDRGGMPLPAPDRECSGGVVVRVSAGGVPLPGLGGLLLELGVGATSAPLACDEEEEEEVGDTGIEPGALMVLI